MWKDTHIFWANLQRSVTPGMAFNSPHQVGVPSWSAWWSNHDSKFLIGGSREGSWLSVAKSSPSGILKLTPILGFPDTVLRMGPSISEVNLMVILRPGSCSVPRSTPRAFLVQTSSLSSMSTLRSHSTLASGPSSMLTPGSCLVSVLLWLRAHGLPLNLLSSLSRSFCKLAVVSMTLWQTSCRATHMLAEGMNPFHSQGHLQHQWRGSAFIAFPEVKRGSPRLLSSFSPHHMRGTLVLYSKDKHYDTHPVVPFRMCGTRLSVEQIDPLQNWVPSHGFGGLSSTCIPPLSAPVIPHARTFHVEWLTDVGTLGPIGDIGPKKDLIPQPIWPPCRKVPLAPPHSRLPGSSPSYFHKLTLKGPCSWRK